ncbi:MAG: hypothetical protein SPL55_08195 [Prevotella sp.]|nr:hypothetical protein [Prevotella sp.]
MKTLKKILKWTIGIALVVMLLIGAATLLLNTNFVQQRLLKRATKMLTDQIGTRVEVESISVNIFGPTLALHGLSIDDKQGRELLRMERLDAKMSLRDLLNKKILVHRVETDGLKAMIVKADKDSTANYQFLIDAFRKDKITSKDSLKHPKMTVDLQHLYLTNSTINYQTAKAENILSIGLLDAEKVEKGYHLKLEKLNLKTDNHRPRRNTGKPHHGWFDAGHLDMTMDLRATVNFVQKDSIEATLAEATIKEPTAGFDITDLHLTLSANRESIYFKNIAFKQGSTSLNVARAKMTIPSKKIGRELAYKADSISGHVILKDIARPFAPVLQNFTLPLRLNTEMSGTADNIVFRGVRVSTNDKLFHVAANGRIDHLHNKELFKVSFDVSQMLAKQGIKEKIICQFPVKRLMMKQLHRLGDIHYTGHFDVISKQESFRGRLTTKGGPMDFHFIIDGRNGRLRGNVSSADFRLGEVMDMDKVGNVDCKAEFNINISKVETAKMRREKGGKLPIGTVMATVNDCSYKKIHVKNLTVNIQSDGAEATGDVLKQSNFLDLYSQFTFTDTDQMHKIKIKHPGLRFHKRRKK